MGSPRAPLAQLAEQLTLNQRVLGSSPKWRIRKVAKTPEKSGVFRFPYFTFEVLAGVGAMSVLCAVVLCPVGACRGRRGGRHRSGCRGCRGGCRGTPFALEHGLHGARPAVTRKSVEGVELIGLVHKQTCLDIQTGFSNLGGRAVLRNCCLVSANSLRVFRQPFALTALGQWDSVQRMHPDLQRPQFALRVAGGQKRRRNSYYSYMKIKSFCVVKGVPNCHGTFFAVEEPWNTSAGLPVLCM